jgi:nucleoside-diphosphate-sugar epimerase
MKILVIGGTGFISKALVQHLLDAGHAVTVCNRGQRPLHVSSPVESVVCDRSVPGALGKAFRSRTFDAVYDMIAYTAEDSGDAVSAFAGRTGRFIHCSTVSVYMVSDEVRCPITEELATLPLMKYWPRNPFGMDYGIQKRGCEDVLWAAHDQQNFPVSMLRPTFVSGPGDPAQRDYFWIERIADGGPLLLPGDGSFAFQQVFIDDVARAFASLLEYPASIGKAYSVAGEEMQTLRDYLRMVGNVMGKEPHFAFLEQSQFDALPLSFNPHGDVFPFNVRRTATFNLEAIRRDLRYRSTPFDEWMAETIRWWMRTGRGHSLGYDRREEEVAIAERVLKNEIVA